MSDFVGYLGEWMPVWFFGGGCVWLREGVDDCVVGWLGERIVGQADEWSSFLRCLMMFVIKFLRCLTI